MSGEPEFFKGEELIYAERSRCECGAGMAYPRDHAREFGRWVCSKILKGEVEIDPDTWEGPPAIFKRTALGSDGMRHGQLPFHGYEVRSELQPGAGTTRPDDEERPLRYDEVRAKLDAEGIPRRARSYQWTMAERAIRSAIDEVERAGASEDLTAAVILLGEAFDKVADHVDRSLAETPDPDSKA